MNQRRQLSISKARRRRRHWVTLGLGPFIFFWVVYVLFVLTAPGQAFENSALLGAKLNPNNPVVIADQQLRVISHFSLALAIIIIAALGFLRGGMPLAVAGAGTIVISVVATEILKHFLLPRPNLVGAPQSLAHNSFPSGHTTIAMSILVATIVVVPVRWRGLAMIFTLTWATGIGALTLAAQWHRLSDTLGANAMALCVGAAASLWLLGRGNIYAAEHRRRPIAKIFFWAMAVLGALTLLLGILLVVLNALRNADSEEFFAINNYLAAHSLAFGASVSAGLLFWASWAGVEAGR